MHEGVTGAALPRGCCAVKPMIRWQVCLAHCFCPCALRFPSGWWYNPDFIINDLNVQSAIGYPAHEEVVPLAGSTYAVRGYAYCGEWRLLWVRDAQRAGVALFRLLARAAVALHIPSNQLLLNHPRSLMHPHTPHTRCPGRQRQQDHPV